MEMTKFIILSVVLFPFFIFGILYGLKKIFSRFSIPVWVLLLAAMVLSTGTSYLIFGSP